MKMGYGIVAAIGVLVLGGLALTFQFPPAIMIQSGFRGTGQATIYHPPTVAKLQVENKAPASLPRVSGGPPAGQVYQNVQVLKDVNVAAFTRLMASITQWVSPTQGCNFCHEGNNMASDAVWTKHVARRMIQMVQNINGEWTNHVGETGVTCYTCHRGQNIPANVWVEPDPPHARGMVQSLTGQNLPAPVAGLASLPYDPVMPYLTQQASQIRVQGTEALPGNNLSSIKQAEWTYSLMMHFSQSLGVDCTYCHNSRAFGEWNQSTHQRTTAWWGIRMTRELNTTYVEPLLPFLPADQLGPKGDAPKLNCATCHAGVYKPLFGAQMAKDFPELGLRPVAATTGAVRTGGAATGAAPTGAAPTGAAPTGAATPGAATPGGATPGGATPGGAATGAGTPGARP